MIRHETDNAQSWTAPPDVLPLSRAEIHVWRATLAQPAGVVQRLRSTLDEDERARAVQFRFEKDRTRFVVARFEPSSVATCACRPPGFNSATTLTGSPRWLRSLPEADETSMCRIRIRSRSSRWRASRARDRCRTSACRHGGAAARRAILFRLRSGGVLRAARRAAAACLLRLLDAQGGIHQSDGRRALVPARRIRRVAPAGRARGFVARQGRQARG